MKTIPKYKVGDEVYGYDYINKDMFKGRVIDVIDTNKIWEGATEDDYEYRIQLESYQDPLNYDEDELGATLEEATEKYKQKLIKDYLRYCSKKEIKD
jgi:hypothetical protein